MNNEGESSLPISESGEITPPIPVKNSSNKLRRFLLTLLILLLFARGWYIYLVLIHQGFTH